MTDFIQTALMDNIEGRSFLEGQGPIVPPPPPDLGTPAYAISLAPSSVREGNELVATITTSNLSNSTRLFVTIGSGGSAVGADFTSSPWPVVIENNKAILRIKPKIDNLIESGETVQLQLRTMSKTGTVVALSNIIGITDIPLPPVPPPLPSRPRILTPVPPPPPPPASPPPQYTIAISPITLMENKVNTIQIYTTNVPDSTDLYVTLNSAGTATYDDFILLPLRTTVSNNNASRSVFSVNDALAETETVQFDLRTGSTGGPVVATTGLLNLIDFVSTLLPKTYSLSLSKFNIAEGETFTGTVTTSNVVAGTVLYLAVLDGGTANAADFTGLPTTVTIANKIGTFSATVALDGISELAESAQIGLYTDAAYTDLVASSGLLLISKSGGEVGVSGYAVSIIPATVAEGASFTATVTTTNVPNGTVLQLTANPFDSASAVDLVGSPWNVTINNNTGTATIPTLVDGTSENTETLRLLLKSAATGETVLATSNSVNIVDITAGSTYQMGMSHLIITEGTSFTITIQTTNVPNGTVLYITQDTTQSGNAADISGIPRTVTINNNTSTATGTVVADNLTEGAETTGFLLRTGSYTGPVVASSSPLLINDTSVTPAVSYTLVATPATVSESGIITVNITTTAVPNGTVVYASMGTTGTATTSDFSNTLWTVTINNNSGIFAANLIADLTTEGTETVDFVIKTGSQAGPIVAVSNLVTISDTSNGGGGTNSGYTLLLSPTSVNEGSTVTGTITTTNVLNATTLYVTPSGTGTANDADFVGEPWTVTVNNNAASFSFTATADSTTEGTETKVFHLRTGSASGSVVAASNVLTINDTSTGGGVGGNYAVLDLISSPSSVAISTMSDSVVYSFSAGTRSQVMIPYTVAFLDSGDNIVVSNPIQCEYRTYNGSFWSAWSSFAFYGLLAENSTTRIEVRAKADTFYTSQVKLRFMAERTMADFGVNNYIISSVAITGNTVVAGPSGLDTYSVNPNPYASAFPTGMTFEVSILPLYSGVGYVEYEIHDSTGATVYRQGIVNINQFNSAYFYWSQAEQLADRGSSTSAYRGRFRRRNYAGTELGAWVNISGNAA